MNQFDFPKKIYNSILGVLCSQKKKKRKRKIYLVSYFFCYEISFFRK